MNDERSGGFLLHDLVLIRFEEKRIAVGEWDVAAHRIDLVCVNSGHDRLHAVRTAIAVGIGTVEQGNMGRRVGKLDLLEDGLRAEEGRVGKACVRKCRARGWPYT